MLAPPAWLDYATGRGHTSAQLDDLKVSSNPAKYIRLYSRGVQGYLLAVFFITHSLLNNARLAGSGIKAPACKAVKIKGDFLLR
jgi:hypothetical protein